MSKHDTPHGDPYDRLERTHELYRAFGVPTGECAVCDDPIGDATGGEARYCSGCRSQVAPGWFA